MAKREREYQIKESTAANNHGIWYEPQYKGRFFFFWWRWYSLDGNVYRTVELAEKEIDQDKLKRNHDFKVVKRFP